MCLHFSVCVRAHARVRELASVRACTRGIGVCVCGGMCVRVSGRLC